jgi:hypothetical protein
LWAESDLPMIRSKSGLPPKKSASCSRVHDSSKSALASLFAVGTDNSMRLSLQTPTITLMRSSCPSFAQVASHGIAPRKSHQATAAAVFNTHRRPPSSAAALPPPLAAWALGSTCDGFGSCCVCGAAGGDARAADPAAAAAWDDPFHRDWRHW